MNRNELKLRMMKLDEMAGRLFPGDTFRCVIVGGGALLSLGIIARGTLDVDVLEAPNQLWELFIQFDFNTKVQSLACCFPYHYQERIVKIAIETRSIEFYTPSVEDLIVSKLYAYRSKDVDDIEKIIKSGQYNIMKLKESIADAKTSALNDRQHDEMVHLYKKHFPSE